MTSLPILSTSALLLAASLPAFAGGYTEGPDLSNLAHAPTLVSVSLGSNIVQGTMGFNGPTLDRDFFRIDIAPGMQLDALVPTLGTQTGGGGSFIGIQAGPVMGIDPDTINSAAPLLGWYIYGSADIGQDILQHIGGGPQAAGFSGPLSAGSYTFWIQELAPPFPGEPFPPFPYRMDLQISAVPVPEPASAALWLAGLLATGGLLRRQKGRQAPR